MDTSELTKERDEVKRKIEEIDNRHKGKTYPEIDNDTISKSIFVIEEKLIPIITNIDGIGKAKMFIKDNRYKKLTFSIMEELDKVNKDIVNIKNDLDKLSFSKNLVKLDYPSGCQFPECKLRVEYESQIEKLNIHQVLNESLITKEKDRDRINEQLIEEERLKGQLTDITKILHDNKILELINDNLQKINIEDILDIPILYKITDKLKACKIYNSDMMELEKLTERLESLSYVVKSSEDNTKDKLNNIKVELADLEEEEKTLKSKLYTINNNLEKFENIKIDESLFRLELSSIDKEKENYLNRINNIEQEIEKLNSVSERKKELNDLIISKNKELQSNTDEYYKLKETINRINILSKDFSETNDHVEKLKILKDIVGRTLPARVMESYLLDIAKLVNYLLEDSMRIRFDTTDGIEIYCTIRGEERLMNMVTRYMEAVDTVKQVFIVSHDFFVSDGMDINVIKMENL